MELDAPLGDFPGNRITTPYLQRAELFCDDVVRLARAELVDLVAIDAREERLQTLAYTMHRLQLAHPACEETLLGMCSLTGQDLALIFVIGVRMNLARMAAEDSAIDLDELENAAQAYALIK
jgi:hypothetical protein